MHTYRYVCKFVITFMKENQNAKEDKSTRRKILEATYEEVRYTGFQGLRPDKVVQSLSITKGALYHYFPNKMSVGYAMVDEILSPNYINNWRPLRNPETNALEYISFVINQIVDHLNSKELAYGSLLHNLIQEMSPVDEGFRKRLQAIIDDIINSIEIGLQNGEPSVDQELGHHIPPPLDTPLIPRPGSTMGIYNNR